MAPVIGTLLAPIAYGAFWRWSPESLMGTGAAVFGAVAGLVLASISRILLLDDRPELRPVSGGFIPNPGADFAELRGWRLMIAVALIAVWAILKRKYGP